MISAARDVLHVHVRTVHGTFTCTCMEYRYSIYMYMYIANTVQCTPRQLCFSDMLMYCTCTMNNVQYKPTVRAQANTARPYTHDCAAIKVTHEAGKGEILFLGCQTRNHPLTHTHSAAMGAQAVPHMYKK